MILALTSDTYDRAADVRRGRFRPAQKLSQVRASARSMWAALATGGSRRAESHSAQQATGSGWIRSATR